MENKKPKFAKQVDQFCDTVKIEDMPTIIRNQIDETPNFDELYNKDEGIGNKFYDELNNFANNCNQTLPTDTSVKITNKKYEIEILKVIDVTSQTNDNG